MEDVPIRVASLHSAKLQLPPSCIEFDPANPPYFIVGTYSLTVPAAAADDDHDHDDQVDGSVPQEVDGLPTQSRSGSLVVFRVLDIGM